MSDDKRDLHPETLAQFEALAQVRDLRGRQGAASRPRVDSSTLLAEVPPVEPAASGHQAGSGPGAAAPAPAAQGRAGPAQMQTVRWYDRPAVLFLMGLSATVALGLLGYVVKVLVGGP